jgi:PTH1 family peptidyl-tRNA hydrolase
MVDSTWLIVGLGNPGAKYLDTRHNVGFLAIELLCQLLSKELHNSSSWSNQKNYEIATVNYAESKLFFLKPLQYMNLSGIAVQEIANFYKIYAHNIIVIHDEADLDFAKVKLKKGGGDAGHNGLKSITSSIGSADYYRYRIGIGRPQAQQNGISDWVLSKFTSEELRALDDIFIKIKNSIKVLLEDNFELAQKTLNKN